MNKISITSINEEIYFFKEDTVIDLDLDDDSYVNINILENAHIIINNFKDNSLKFEASLNRNSSLIINSLTFDSSIKSKIYLKGDNSSVVFNNSSISNKDVKLKTKIYHLANNTRSEVFNHLIQVNEESVIKTYCYVEKGFKDCYVNQDNKIINLSDKKSKIEPNLYIDEYTTDANHSAYIGNFSKEEVFYMKSRGLSFKDSYNLLIKGFLLKNMILDDDFNQMVIKKIDSYGGEINE